MKAFTRKLCLALVTMGLLGVTGCGADNEADGKAASQKLGDAGKPDPNAKVVQGTTPPKTNEGRTALGPQGTQNMFKEKAKPSDVKPSDKK